MGSQGPNAPQVGVNEGSFGLGWQGLPSYLQVDDATSAHLVTGLVYPTPTRLAKLTDFQFGDVPDTAESVTVVFRVKRRKVGQGEIQDSAARLVLGGVTQTAENAIASNWPTTAAWAEYTFTGLTPVQVKDSGFGFALSVKNVSPGDEEYQPPASPSIGCVEATAGW